MRDRFPSVPAGIREKIRFVFLDERLVPPDHADSNYRLLSEILFVPLLAGRLVSPEQVVAVRTDVPHPEREYSDRVPVIDIGLFGVGPDGHVASLFPNHPGLRDDTGRYVRILTSPKPPPDRISVSVRTVLGIPSVFAFFMGEGKREAYGRSSDPHITKEQCPVKYLLTIKDCTVVTDLADVTT